MARRMLPKSRIKRYISHKTGIPTTRSGRKAKARRLLTGGCCMVYVLLVMIGISALVVLLLGVIF